MRACCFRERTCQDSNTRSAASARSAFRSRTFMPRGMNGSNLKMCMGDAQPRFSHRWIS